MSEFRTYLVHTTNGTEERRARTEVEACRNVARDLIASGSRVLYAEPVVEPVTTTDTPAVAVKGGDALYLGGEVVEVFDTRSGGFAATLVRYLDPRSGEVLHLRVADEALLSRVVR